MIILPWYIRLAIDTVIIVTPFIYLNKHPTLFFEYFQDQRRIKRRRSLQTQEELYGNYPQQSLRKQEAEAFYNELGIKYE